MYLTPLSGNRIQPADFKPRKTDRRNERCQRMLILILAKCEIPFLIILAL